MKKNILIISIILIIVIISFICGMILPDKIGTNKTKEISNTPEKIIEEENKEKSLNIARTDHEISKYFPKNIDKIVLTNYLSDTSNPTTYVIEDYDKMKEFIELFFSTNWKEDTTHYSEEAQAYFNRKPNWKINFIGDITTTFNMMGLSTENYAEVVADNGIENKRYLISESIYREILAFANTRYYLHKSDLEIPNRDLRYVAQTKVFTGLTDERKEYIKENFRYVHQRLERDLMSAVNVLKDKNSPYWESYTKAGTYQDPNGFNTFWESDGGFSKILETVQNYANEIQNETAKSELEIACRLLKQGIDNRDLSKFFEAHEIIHDYDYWIFSVEPSFVTFAPADWEGTRTYFGKTALIENK